MAKPRYLMVFTTLEAALVRDALQHHAPYVAAEDHQPEHVRQDHYDVMVRLATAIHDEIFAGPIDQGNDNRAWNRDDAERAWPEWDQAAASFEGWQVVITDVDGSMGLRRIAEAGIFDSDQEAVTYVRGRALDEESELHRRALALTGND